MNLTRIVALDTETTGLDRVEDKAVCMALAPAGGKAQFFAWGHPSGNNCSVHDAQKAIDKYIEDGWTIVCHNAQFDLTMLKNVGIVFDYTCVEDTGTIAPLLSESEPSYSLDNLAKKYTKAEKVQDDKLNKWCAAKFGGAAEAAHQVGNYHLAPGALVGPYCIGDAYATLKLYQALRPKLAEPYDKQGRNLEDIYEIERKLLPVLMRMHEAGVRVDVDKAKQTNEALMREHSAVQANWDQHYRVERLAGKKGVISVPANYNSSIDMKEILDREGIEYGETATSRKPKKDGSEGRIIPKVDKAFLQSLDHPMAKQILLMRKLKKTFKDFIQKYVLSNADEHGIIHGEFHPLKSETYGTISGRFSSGGRLNLQNITKLKSEDDPYKHITESVRLLFVPMRDDMRWVSVDYSQIEYRFLAYYASLEARRGAGAILAEYVRSKEEGTKIDFHQMVSDLTGVPRPYAKNINFGILYGMGVPKLARTLKLSLEEAEAVMNEYNSNAPEIKSIFNLCKRLATNRGYLRTWGGRVRRFERIRTAAGGRFDKTHSALNALLQGSAADLLKIKMIEVDKLIDWQDAILSLTVHDELDFSIVNGERGDRMIRDIKECMETVDISVPIIANVETGSSWGTLKEWNFSSSTGSRRSAGSGVKKTAPPRRTSSPRPKRSQERASR